jgi:hypothetical protein
MSKLDDLTLGELRSIADMFRASPNPGPDEFARLYHASIAEPWEIGACYLIRTVTMIDTGRLVAVTPQELVLEDAAWIADTGRFADAVKSVQFSEVEPFPAGRLIVGRGSIIDAVKIDSTPRSQK